jgi:hypothetical protein
MEIVANIMDWTTVDEQNWAHFLDTDTGKRLIPKLLESTPALLATGEINAILIRSGEVRGIQEIARMMLDLAHPQVKVAPVANEYPALDADDAWNDGQRLNETPTK